MRTKGQEDRLIELGFTKSSKGVYTKQVGNLSIKVGEYTIDVTNVDTLDYKTYFLQEDGMEVIEDIHNVTTSTPITEDEARAAGFDFLSDICSKVYGGFKFTIDFGMNTYFRTACGSAFAKQIFNPTKEQVAHAYHYFTGERLDFEPKQKVYNWETCFKGNGWYIDSYSRLSEAAFRDNTPRDYNVYPTKEDAEAALAHCQLLHIVNAINKDYPGIDGEIRYYTVDHNPTVEDYRGIYTRMFDKTGTLGGFNLCTQKGAEILIRDNEQLLKTYFKIK